jgi:hypothetical protein
MTAFAARELNEPELKDLAWYRFLEERVGRDGAMQKLSDRTVEIAPPDALHPIDENAGVSTNDVAQWNINAIILLELAGDRVPALDEIIRQVNQARANAPQRQRR